MRADRLLSTLLLLQVHRRMTARELARRLEVSERTIHRDMEALSGAGVPVVADRGTGGGWRLLEAYRTDLTGLNEAEIQALFLTKPPRLLADLGLDRASEAALIKLLAALPSVSRHSAQDIRQRIHIETAGWRSPDETFPHLPALQEAVWQERKLRLTYRRSDETTVERVVDPLGLVAKGSTWYLVAAVEGDPRTYRASRVLGTELLDEPCCRPLGFDLAAYWERSAVEFKAHIPKYAASLRVDPSLLSYAKAAGRFVTIAREYPPDADGWVRLDMLFDGGEHNAREYALSFDTRVEVLEPPELRESVLRAAERIVALYGEKAEVSDK